MIEQLSKAIEHLKDSDLRELLNLLKTWTDFKEQGGNIGGDITIPVIGAIGTAIKANQQSISTMTPKITSWTDFQANGGTIGGDIRLSVGMVGGTLTAHGRRLTDIESLNDTQSQDISTLKRDVSTNASSISTINKTLSGHGTSINTLGNRISTWETFKNNGGTLGGDISLPKIGSVTAKIESNTQEINGIKDSVVGNKPIIINDSVPIGTIMFRNIGAPLPSGWLLCDGASVLQADYPELYAVISKTYGGDTTRFKLPLMVDGTTLVIHGEKNSSDTVSKIVGQQGIIKAKSTASENIDIAQEWANFKANGGKVSTISLTPGVDGDTINTQKTYLVLGGEGLNAIRIGNAVVEPIPKSAGGIALGSNESPFSDLNLASLGSVKDSLNSKINFQKGTWNPVLYEGTSGNTPTSHDSSGSFYYKLDKLVVATFNVTINPNVIPEAWKGAAMLLKWLPFPIDTSKKPTHYISYYEGFMLPTDCIGLCMYRHATTDSFWIARMNKYNSYGGVEWGTHCDRAATIQLQGTIIYFTP